MNNKIRTISYDNRARLFWVLAAISILSLLTYVYGINTLARNVATSQNLERQIAKTSANFSLLEFTYIEQRNNITMELAYQHGFREVKSPLYVSRSHAPSLSFNTPNR